MVVNLNMVHDSLGFSFMVTRLHFFLPPTRDLVSLGCIRKNIQLLPLYERSNDLHRVLCSERIDYSMEYRIEHLRYDLFSDAAVNNIVQIRNLLTIEV